MKAHYRAFNGRLIVEVEGSNIKELFEQIGPVAEVLDGDDACGKCSSVHIYPRAREAQGFIYYELVCSDCGAKLSFGQHKDGGTLWAKRLDEHGVTLDHRGWKIYLGIEAPKQSAPAAKPPAAPPSAAPVASKRDDRLEQLLARCTSVGSAGDVMGEVCDAIRGFTDDRTVDVTWNAAIKRHGDPARNTQAVRGIMADLLAVLKNAEDKAIGVR